ncbi:ATP-binding protein, partial [bacterium]|nr:ATP-binding protein [bacterium]
REKLEGITGRNRDRQMELAREIGLENFESPGGGCLLTDENFAKKMVDFIKHDTFLVEDIPVIKYGRHFRLQDGAKLVVGRDQADNAHLEAVESEKYMHIKTLGLNGPHSLISKNATQKDLDFAAKAILTYCKITPETEYSVSFDEKPIQVTPFNSREVLKPFSVL